MCAQYFTAVEVDWSGFIFYKLKNVHLQSGECSGVKNKIFTIEM